MIHVFEPENQSENEVLKGLSSMKGKILKGLSLLAGNSVGGKVLNLFIQAVARGIHPRSKVAMENLGRVFPEKDRAWKKNLLSKHYDHLSMSAVEFLALARAPQSCLSWVESIEGEEFLQHLLEPGKGAVILTGHVGNWELLSAWLCRKGVPLSAVVQRNEDPEVESFIDGCRTAAGLNTISKSFGMRGAVKVLRKGGVLGLLMDQHGGDLVLPFFGKPARTFGGPAAFARLADVPIIPVFAYRTGFFRHRVVIHPPIAIPDGLESGEFISQVTADCNAVLEKAILRFPEQWLWLHRRWRQ